MIDWICKCRSHQGYRGPMVILHYRKKNTIYLLFYYRRAFELHHTIFFFFGLFFRATHTAHGGSQTRGWITAVAYITAYTTDTPRLWPTPQLTTSTLNPLSEARDWACTLMDASQIRFHRATTGTPSSHYFFLLLLPTVLPCTFLLLKVHILEWICWVKGVVQLYKVMPTNGFPKWLHPFFLWTTCESCLCLASLLQLGFVLFLLLLFTFTLFTIECEAVYCIFDLSFLYY